jgi:hypothetical protein
MGTRTTDAADRRRSAWVHHQIHGAATSPGSLVDCWISPDNPHIKRGHRIDFISGHGEIGVRGVIAKRRRLKDGRVHLWIKPDA